MTLTEIKKVLAERNLRPLESLGQNFLFDQNICHQIVSYLEPANDGNVLEIGPGLGSLTEILLDLNIHLTALEIDKGLCTYLREKFQHYSNFALIEGDATETLLTLKGISYAIGNLPYNVSTPLLASLLQMKVPPQRCVFMLQKEMAERLSASPRSRDYGAISVLLQSYYHIEPLKTLKGNVFYPAPSIDSSVIKLSLRDNRPDFTPQQQQEFYNLIRKGFSQRRKKLRNLIDFDGEQRAEELSVDDWQKLFRKKNED